MPTTYQQGKQLTAGYQLRKTQLYDNARLLCPDGQPLSVVERSKARSVTAGYTLIEGYGGLFLLSSGFV